MGNVYELFGTCLRIVWECWGKWLGKLWGHVWENFVIFWICFDCVVKYAQIEIVVTFLVVEIFGFLVITRSPLQWILVKLGGNESYRPPGAF